MTTRQVFGTIIKNGLGVENQPITYKLIEENAHNASGIVPVYTKTTSTDDDGYFSMNIDVPDDGAEGWIGEWDFGDGKKRRYAIGAGDPVNIVNFIEDPNYPPTSEEYEQLHPALAVTLAGAANAFTAVSQELTLQSPVRVGKGSQFIWEYAAGSTPPTTAATLQAEAEVATAVAVGDWCVTSTGDLYKCTNATNQAALVWVAIALAISSAGGANTVVARDENGYLGQTTIANLGFGKALEVYADSGDGISVELGDAISDYIEFTGKGKIDKDGVLRFTGGSAATNRNAQLAELFTSIPTSAGASGTLWNDGGVIKKVP